MTLSRRELLKLTLGAPLLGLAPQLLASCAKRPLPEGELLDFGRERAHRALRHKGLTLEAIPADTPRRSCRVVVVGAGIAGLSAAWRLAGAGLTERDLAICELEPVAGGTARSGRSELTAFPWGAHYVVAPFKEDRAMVRLLTELGALDGFDAHGHPRASEHAAVRELEERHFYEGAFEQGLYPHFEETAAEKADHRRFDSLLQELGMRVDSRGRRLFELPTRLVSEDPAISDLDAMTFGAWLDLHGLKSWRLRWLCDYACRDDYGTSVEECSAWAGLLYFIARKRPEHEIWDRPVITWPEGNGHIVNHLAHIAGPRLKTGELVIDVDANDNGARVLALDSDDRPVLYQCERVIVATPRHVAARIVRAYRESPPAWLSAFTTAPWIVANLHLSRRPETEGVAHAWDTVFVGSRSVGYVDAPHQLGRDHGPTVLTWYRPLTEESRAARAEAEAVGREGWAEAALSELELGHPDIRDCVTRIDVGRIGHAMVRPTPNLRRHLVSAQTPPHSRIAVAHTDLSGLALCEEALDHGIRVAELTLTGLGLDGGGTWR